MTDKTESTPEQVSGRWAVLDPTAPDGWTRADIPPMGAVLALTADELDDAFTGETARILLARLRGGVR
jgi:hypothetical protein